MTACQPRPPAYTSLGWQYADLRALDGVDGTQPGADMLAYYFQQAGGEGRLRLDFFDQVTGLEEDIYLALDTLPGGTQSLPIGAHAQIDWDLLVVVPANGEIYTLDPKFNRVSLPPIWVSRDPQQDTFSLAWQGSLLEFAAPDARLKGVEIFTTAAGETALADQLGPLDAWGPPPQPADALLVFWDTYPAYTPALALRRWDGAHTGPLGGRHGLVKLAAHCCEPRGTPHPARPESTGLPFRPGLYRGLAPGAALGGAGQPDIAGEFAGVLSRSSQLANRIRFTIAGSAQPGSGGIRTARSGFEAGTQPVYFRPAAGWAG